MHDTRSLQFRKYLAGLCLGVVGCLVHLQVAAQSVLTPDPGYARFVAALSGNAATVAYASDGTALAARAGTVAESFATGPTLSRALQVGTKYGPVGFKAAQRFSAKALATAAVGGISGGIAGMLLGAGVYAAGQYVADWLSDAGVSADPAGGVRGADPTVCTVAPCTEYRVDYVRDGVYVDWATTQEATCGAFAAFMNQHKPNASTSYGNSVMSPVAGYCRVNWYYNGAYQGYFDKPFGSRTVAPQPEAYVPLTEAEAVAKLEAAQRTTDELFGVLLESVQAIPSASLKPEAADKPVVSDPVDSEVRQSTKTTTNPDGSTTTEQSNCKVKGSTAGQVVKLSEVCTTTTTTTPVSGSPTTTTTTTDSEQAPSADPQAPDNSGFCDSLLGKVLCWDVGDPLTDQIPKVTRDLTYSPENLFGGGSCPADKTYTFGANTVNLTNMSQTCGFLADFVKPIAIVLATFSAVIIVIGGTKQ